MRYPVSKVAEYGFFPLVEEVDLLSMRNGRIGLKLLGCISEWMDGWMVGWLHLSGVFIVDTSSALRSLTGS
jgi:hypothetical protein